MIDDEADDLDDDIGEGAPEAEPSAADTLTRDVEEAVGQQLAEKGHPNPYEGLQGRDDSHPGGRYEGLEEYAATAKANGTSIQAAVKDYVEAEQILRKDFPSGVEYLCRRLGQDPRALVGALYQRYYGPGGNQHMAGIARQQQHAHYASQVAAFERNPANKHFGAVRNQMAQIVQDGKASTLDQAYRLAVKANPRLGIQDRLDKELSRKDRRARR